MAARPTTRSATGSSSRSATARALHRLRRARDGPDARAKYLNSRETPLFDKGRALYNHGPAREAAGKGQPLIVAEGYMDVIALVAAGLRGGRRAARHRDHRKQLQIALAYRARAGDRARRRQGRAPGGDASGGPRPAASRPDKSLRFAILPEGQDPDDLIRARGPSAMQEAIDRAEPLVKLLWRRETEGKVFDTPERRAGLDKRLRTAIGLIKNTSLQRHYADALAASGGSYSARREVRRAGAGPRAGGDSPRRRSPRSPRPARWPGNSAARTVCAWP
jgi:DNA primase